VLVAVATASVAAGVIHLAAIPEHWATYRLAGIFFIAIGAFEILWAVLLVVRPRRILYLAGAVVNVGTIATWALSRTTGLPFGPARGVPEAVGRPDVIATVLEELLVLGIILLTAPWKPVPLPRRIYRAGLAVTAAVAVLGTVWALAAMHGRALPVIPRGSWPASAGPNEAWGRSVPS